MKLREKLTKNGVITLSQLDNILEVVNSWDGVFTVDMSRSDEYQLLVEVERHSLILALRAANAQDRNIIFQATEHSVISVFVSTETGGWAFDKAL